jgi:hypothetical protein
VALAVDGVAVDALMSFGGLDMQATVVTDAPGPGGYPKKHVSDVGWSPAQASVGLSMGRGLHGWIKATFDNGATTRNGALTTGDFNYKAQSVLSFNAAVLTSVTIPRLDGSSKEPGHIDVTFAPALARIAPGDGSDMRGPLAAKTVAWLCANFRVEVGALPCARVASVESFTLTCTPAAGAIGIFRQPGDARAVVAVPDLRLTISYADHAQWAATAQQWFVGGAHLEGNELQGAIVMLAADMTTELGRITLGNIGFKRFSDSASSATSAAVDVARFTVDLYVEKMGFQLAQYPG